MTEAPDICGDRRYLVSRKLCSSHRWHGTAILLGLGHSVSDGLPDAAETPVAPHPLLARKVGTQRRSLSSVAMATGASGATDLSAINAFPQFNHLPRSALGYGETWGGGCTGVGMRTLRWLRRSFNDLSGGSGRTRTLFDFGVEVRITPVNDPVDTSAHIVGNIQSPIWADRQTTRTVLGSGR